MSRATYSCCNPIYWKHDDGWDVYRREDCVRLLDGSWVPEFFDLPIVEDLPTKKDAQKEVSEMHPFGICLVERW